MKLTKGDKKGIIVGVMIALIIMAAIIIRVLAESNSLPCSWMEGNFVINDSVFQSYKARCGW